jgi:hypothetical protein
MKQGYGPPSHAQLAYLKAVAPNTQAAARDLGEQRHAVKALLAQVQLSARSSEQYRSGSARTLG